MSFEIIENKLEAYEHLSHFDPDDEWLKVEKGSFIESIQSSRKLGSRQSDFSAFDLI